MSEQRNYIHPHSFEFESGEVLNELTIGYHTYGSLNADASNVVWICHGLTGNSAVEEWWKGFVGQGALINPDEHFIVCANMLGSNYGTSGPLSVNPKTGNPYYTYFPVPTIRDMVAVHQLLAAHLGIEKINLLVGGSIGGQQALEWAVSESDRISNLVLIATNAKHSPWGIAFNEAQRMAILADRTYYSQTSLGGSKGLRAARAIAMLSYRNYGTYSETQAEELEDKVDDFKSASYQRYQGDKLVNRFNAFSYVRLGQAMDSHNVGRDRGGVELALTKVKAKTVVIGVDSDLLFPTSEQQFLALHIPEAQYAEITSLYGHDGFLLETEQLNKCLDPFWYRADGKTNIKNQNNLQEAIK